jgi:hypothetical protein
MSKLVLYLKNGKKALSLQNSFTPSLEKYAKHKHGELRMPLVILPSSTPTPSISLALFFFQSNQENKAHSSNGPKNVESPL